MKILAIANQKGGVGKTTTTIELASCLGILGKKVLVIDCDQQANLTTYLGVSGDYATLTDVMDQTVTVKDGILHGCTLGDNVDVIPASEELSLADKRYTSPSDIYLLEDICKIAEELNGYDYVVMDNSPSRNVILTMNYIAADYVIVPTECDSGSVSGILAVEKDISKLRDGAHPMSHAEIAAIILTKYERTTMHEMAMDAIKKISETEIRAKSAPLIRNVRKTVKVSEVKTLKHSMQHSGYRSILAAMDYRKLTADLIKRWEG